MKVYRRELITEIMYRDISYMLAYTISVTKRGKIYLF